MSKKSRDKKLAYLKDQRERLCGLYNLAGGEDGLGLDEATRMTRRLLELSRQIEELEGAKKKRRKVHNEEPSLPDEPPYLRAGTVAHKRKRKSELKKEICENHPVFDINDYNHSRVDQIAEFEYYRELKGISRE